MLFLLFQISGDRYALESSRLVEVLPLVELKKVPQAVRGVAGIFNYRGTPVPVLDLSELMLGHPAALRLSTRIILTRYPDGLGGTDILGLIAERAIETFKREPGDFVSSGVASGGAPYLGPVVKDDRGMVQWVEVEKLLPAEVRSALFRQVAEMV